jgi:hypothetical protein
VYFVLKGFSLIYLNKGAHREIAACESKKGQLAKHYCHLHHLTRLASLKLTIFRTLPVRRGLPFLGWVPVGSRSQLALAVQTGGAKNLGQRFGLGDRCWGDRLTVGSRKRKARLNTSTGQKSSNILLGINS